jgi:hypothetical protein
MLLTAATIPCNTHARTTHTYPPRTRFHTQLVRRCAALTRHCLHKHSAFSGRLVIWSVRTTAAAYRFHQPVGRITAAICRSDEGVTWGNAAHAELQIELCGGGWARPSGIGIRPFWLMGSSTRTSWIGFQLLPREYTTACTRDFQQTPKPLPPCQSQTDASTSHMVWCVKRRLKHVIVVTQRPVHQRRLLPRGT